MLRADENLFTELIPLYAKNPISQHYLIELFVDEDHLNGYYGMLLDHYHQYRNKEKQELLFYYCLKFTQALQTKKLKESTTWLNKLATISLDDTVHEIPAARYLGILIGNNRLNEDEAITLTEKYITRLPYDRSLGFTFYLCKELFSAESSFLLFVIKTWRRTHGNVKPEAHWSVKMKNELLIYEAYAEYCWEKLSLAKDLFNKIDPLLFDVFIYQTMTVHQETVASGLGLKTNFRR